MNKSIKILALAMLLASPVVAQAADCSTDCPAGQVMTGMLGGSNGNSVNCECRDPGAVMEDNPADGNVPYGGEGQEQ